ncbi:RNA 2'-O ribose methyltransferase substrate binding family protein [Chlamydia ibidis]|uniref:RNA 2'-O ribose methyltransferase substrate binding family protein n=2 Tax=Chlamydia ibidis TaxID=1405396 RepID=S7KLM9_9CHLA|nr:RNA methyltransferase [Chlamydia ibidis]EPP35340.1 RNA 2'-O ribose methyltransferase substrate binding family protein [Chlamydia ibidis]EQM62873.1 RNA 2'-O ribose methyltransferase substrate binding family protein [Chlamydia ibidis 10-1398/6]
MEFIGKHNLKLKEALAIKRSKGRKSALFLLEGFREIHKALNYGYECVRIFCSPNVSEKERGLYDLIQNSNIERLWCSDSILSQLSYKENHDNFIAVMKKKWWDKDTFLRKKRNELPFYLIIEQVEKPGNVGALLRIADGAGVDGVILCDPVIDLYNPNLLRSSLGTAFTLPIWQASLEEVFITIAQEKWEVFVTSPGADAMYFDKNYQKPIALVFGSEKDGLTSSWLDGRFAKIALPMKGEADSLNLSTAVSAIVYEVVRQRCLS